LINFLHKQNLFSVIRIKKMKTKSFITSPLFIIFAIFLIFLFIVRLYFLFQYTRSSQITNYSEYMKFKIKFALIALAGLILCILFFLLLKYLY
jgi:hypothetical protein